MEDRKNKIEIALKKIRKTYNVNESKVSARREVYNTKLSELIKNQTFVENEQVKKAAKQIIKNVILGEDGIIYHPDFDLFIHKIKKVPPPRRFETKERKTRVTEEEFIYVVEFSSNDNNFFHNKYCIRVEELDEVKIVDGEEEDLGDVRDADADYEVVFKVNDEVNDDRVIRTRTRAGLFDVLRYNYKNLRNLSDDEITAQKIKEIDDPNFANKVGIGRVRVRKMLNDTTEDDVEIQDLRELYIKINEDGESYTIFENTEQDGVTIVSKKPMAVVDDSVEIEIEIEENREKISQNEDNISKIKQKIEQDIQEPMTAENNNNNTDFNTMLKNKKGKWRQLRNDRKAIKKLMIENANLASRQQLLIQNQLDKLKLQRQQGNNNDDAINQLETEINQLETEINQLEEMEESILKKYNLLIETTNEVIESENDSEYEDEDDSEDSRGSSADEELESDADENSSSDDSSDLLPDLPYK